MDISNIKEYIPSNTYYSNTIHTLDKYKNISQKIFIKMTCELIFKNHNYTKNHFHIDNNILSSFLDIDIRNIDKEIIQFRNNNNLRNYIYNIYQFQKYYPNIKYIQDKNEILVLYNHQKYSIKHFNQIYMKDKLFLDFPIKIFKKRIQIEQYELVIILSVGNIEIAINILQNLLTNYNGIFLAVSVNNDLKIDTKLLNLIEMFDNYIIYQTCNYGFDITPFLHVYNDIKKYVNFDFIFKIHTKSDPNWRSSLLNSFYRSKWNTLKKNVDNNYVGICSQDNLICNSHFNLQILNKHFKDFDNYKFVQGTIFIVQKKYIDCMFKEDYKYLLKGLTYHTFYYSNYLFFKNSPAHAIERIFGFEIYKDNKKYYTI